MKKLALISVSDKTNITELARALAGNDYSILATGNTAKLLAQSGIETIEVSSFTGSPEIFNGRVKTLHPKIFGGLLFRRENSSDVKEAEDNGIAPIDIVCVNLYPFKKTVEKPGVEFEEVIENIDIGGPSLIRAAAKNYKYVSVLTNPAQYESFINELNQGGISAGTRTKLAAEAFSHTSDYDTYIANHLEQRFGIEENTIRINLKKEQTLRYGENPHQQAAVYGSFGSYFESFHGKEISYNNILDLVAAVELVEDLDKNSCAIIKHNNPAGAATASSGFEAYLQALKCDPVSAYGGIVAFNTVVDEETAKKLNEIFLEVVSAPGYTDEALKLLLKKKDRRLVKQLKPVKNSIAKTMRTIPGGMLVQDGDNILLNKENLQTVTVRKPGADELDDLLFAWTISKHTKSNAIVFAKDKAALGVGAGQMSRIDSCRIAEMKAKEHGLDLKNSVAASDAYFPFPDGLLEIIKCGATAVIQPGGSIRDKEVIEAADAHNIAMVFTGYRHFKH